MIYITEAHACDVWNIGESAGTINFKHKTIDDRVTCMDKLKTTFNLSIPMYADNMSNDFETEYASWPFRYYVVKNKKLIKIGSPDDSTFDICELLQYIEQQI